LYDDTKKNNKLHFFAIVSKFWVTFGNDDDSINNYDDNESNNYFSSDNDNDNVEEENIKKNGTDDCNNEINYTDDVNWVTI